MTRAREPRHIALLRRKAHEIDGGSHGARLDAIAQANGHGTWSSLVKSHRGQPKTIPARPFPDLYHLGFDRGGVVCRLVDGTEIRLCPGISMACFTDDDGRTSKDIAASAVLTDDDATFIVHGDGALMRRTSRHRSTVGDAMIAGDVRSHGCRIEPLSRPWMPEGDRNPRSHVASIIECLTGNDGPDAELHHQILDCAMSAISQSDDVAMEDVLAEASRRHGLTPWSRPDLAATVYGRLLGPEDLDGSRPATIYFGRTTDPSSRYDRMARTVQTAISRIRLGMSGLPSHHMTVIYDGQETWQDQPTLLQAGDLGRSKMFGQILCGGSRAAFEQTAGPIDSILYDTVTAVTITGDATNLRIGVYRHEPVPVLTPAASARPRHARATEIRA